MLSKREKTVAIVTVAALGVFLGDSYLLGPLMQSREKMAHENATLKKQIDENNRLLARQNEANVRWTKMLQSGLSDSPSVAESQLLNEMDHWALDAGLDLKAIRPERLNDKGELREIVITASSIGSMRSITRFLTAIETSPLPMRVKRFQLDHRGDKGEDLTLEIQVSTLYLSGKSAAPRPGGKSS